MKTKIYLIFLLCFGALRILAQTYEEQYLQEEETRLDQVQIIENEIQTFIEQNINSYDFTDVINSMDTTNRETGQPLSSTEYKQLLVILKRQKLREVYFKNNPEKITYYYSKTFQQCVNGGFEQNGGSTAGYSFATNTYSHNYWMQNQYSLSPANSVNAVPNTYVSLVDTSSLDPNIPSIPRVYTGRYAIRLNQPTQVLSRTASMLRRQFTVNENSISYAYALFFQNSADGGHENDTRYAYYQVRLRDINGNVIFQRIVDGITNSNLLNYNSTNNILYTGWRCETIDTSRFIGEFVTLEIIMSNCGNSGHYGYGYFDDFCGLPSNCNVPTTGTISLNPQRNIKCPTDPMLVTGNFTIPSNSTLQGLGVELDILNATNGNVVNTLIFPVTTSSSFSFNVNGNSFYPNGLTSNTKFNFRARLKYFTGGVLQPQVVANNTNPPGPDVSFEGCNTPCFEEMYINEPIIVSQTFQASNSIYASSYIHPNLLVDYRTGYQVQLLPGFYATGYNKGVFHAYIGPCEENNVMSRTSSQTPIIKRGETIVKGSDIKIYPNPTFKYINIDSENEKLISWELYDLSGKNILKGNSKQFNVQSLPKAFYLLKVKTDKKQIIKKVIVR